MGCPTLYGLLLALAALMACCQAATRRDPRQCPRCPSGSQRQPLHLEILPSTFLSGSGPTSSATRIRAAQPFLNRRLGFTLHGLWPNLDNACQKDYPEHCSQSGGFDTFDVGSVQQATLDDMERDWPSYTSANECFWSHEWDCHGSCSGLSQQEYFQRVLDLHSQYNISAALAAKNIIPSSTTVDTSEFLDALTSDFGAQPLLYCQRGGGQDYINEIFMCFTKDLRAVDCPEVCRVHPCEPRGNQMCADSLTYKLGPVQSKPEKPCTESFRTCRPKSGTCAD